MENINIKQNWKTCTRFKTLNQRDQYHQIHSKIAGRKLTYGSFVMDMKEHKEENERTILAVGGGAQIEYPGDKSTRTARLLVIDITHFYVNTSLG
jgi:hypothetical protein